MPAISVARESLAKIKPKTKLGAALIEQTTAHLVSTHGTLIGCLSASSASVAEGVTE